MQPAQGFYGRWAGVYDALSHRTPGIRTLRARAVDTLDLRPGDTVVDIGCGSGANVPHLRRAVGPSGTIIGVDFTGPILERARRNHARTDEPHISFVRGDVTDLPLREPVDAIYGSFLAGMLPHPVTAVDHWTDHLRPGGRIALLDAALGDARVAWPLNQAVKAMVFASSPRKSAEWNTAPWATVTRRVNLAHAEIRGNAAETTDRTWLLGTVRVTAGRIE